MQLTHLKPLTCNFRVALSALLCSVAVATAASAQEVASSWVKVAPPNEAFTVSMPGMPSPVAEQSNSGTLKVTGQRYRVRQEDAEYTVWSFEPVRPLAPDDDRMAYLDQCAEIARRVIVKLPGWIKPKRGSLTYDKLLSSDRLTGMRYRIDFGKQSGIAHIYAVGSQIYIVAAWGAARASASVEEFVRSFTLNLPVREAPVPAGGIADVERRGTGWGYEARPGDYSLKPGGRREAGVALKETDYRRIFTAREVTQKAQILKMPQPNYTEGAREVGVTGKVRVHFILWPSGIINNIHPISRLPHGLTWEAIQAARRIKFIPAMKDGRAVAQYMIAEYNFNIY